MRYKKSEGETVFQNYYCATLLPKHVKQFFYKKHPLIYLINKINLYLCPCIAVHNRDAGHCGL